MAWVTRVPLSIKEAKEIGISLYSEEFNKSELQGYSWQEVENNYAGIKQRWLVVESPTRKESDIIKLEEKNQLGKLTPRPTLRWIFQCASRHSFRDISRH